MANEADHWRPMASAPRDGSRVLATVRSAEQGPAEVDVVYWARADASGIEGWRAADSYPGRVIFYADPELKCWMPMPTADPQSGTAPDSRPAPFEGDEIEVDGSGI